MICQIENSDDRRSKLISLTEETLDMRHELDNAGDRLEEVFMENLSNVERKEMIALLTRTLKKDQNKGDK